MDCTSARTGLWPPEKPRLAGPEVQAARRHVDGCAECAEYFAQDREILDLYDRARVVPAPLHLRERVYDELSRARWDRAGGRRPFARALVAMAAAAAAAAVILTPRYATVPGDDGQETAVFVEDYLRRAVSQEHIVTDDPAEVRRFLQRELGVPVAPLTAAGLEISRAEVCLLAGELGAMIVYKRDGAEVSHYVMPKSGRPRAPSLASSGSTAQAPVMPVVTWATDRAEQALVGELDSSALLRLARLGRSQRP